MNYKNSKKKSIETHIFQNSRGTKHPKLSCKLFELANHPNLS